MAKRARTRKAATMVVSPTPTSTKAWLAEIADAFADAAETIPCGPFTVKPGDLFHLGPIVCLKFRGIKATKAKLEKATEAALASYEATTGEQPGALALPHIAFAFCYLVAHFGLDLMTQDEVVALMDYVVEHERQLVRLADQSLQRRGLGPARS